MDTLGFIREHKVIAICRRVGAEDLTKLGRALVKGGVRCMEITFDQADPNCNGVTHDLIAQLVRECGDELCVGAGTVLSTAQVDAAKSAGAKYIISPNADEEVIRYTKAQGLVSIPGAMTPTEILFAWKCGADIVKLFPAGWLGERYIKDILAPIPMVPLCATGGVTEENLGMYLGYGFAGAGVSSRLCDRKCIAEGNFGELTERARAFAKIAGSFKDR